MRAAAFAPIRGVLLLGDSHFDSLGMKSFYDGGLGVYEPLEYLGRKMGLGIALHSRCLEGFSGAWDTKDWNMDSPLRYGMIGLSEKHLHGVFGFIFF